LSLILITRRFKPSICLLTVALSGCGSNDGNSPSSSSAEKQSIAAGITDATPKTTTSVIADAGVSMEAAATVTAAAISGPIVNAASCNAVAVSAAITTVVNGGTVNVPAGDCNWGTTQVNVPAGIYLHGAGKNATIIRRSGTVANNNYLIAYNCTNGRRAVISDMTLIGNYDPAIQGDLKNQVQHLSCKVLRCQETIFT
jgi:hypothetical protein